MTLKKRLSLKLNQSFNFRTNKLTIGHKTNKKVIITEFEPIVQLQIRDK
jgi:hypothetical protein